MCGSAWFDLQESSQRCTQVPHSNRNSQAVLYRERQPWVLMSRKRSALHLTMSFESTAKLLAERMLSYNTISRFTCVSPHGASHMICCSPEIKAKGTTACILLLGICVLMIPNFGSPATQELPFAWPFPFACRLGHQAVATCRLSTEWELKTP